MAEFEFHPAHPRRSDELSVGYDTLLDMADEQTYDFDVAVSFAGENRAYVESVVRGLDLDQVVVFYDDDHKVEMWGKDLVEEFTNLYQHRARYVAMFISAPYAQKMWTNVERRSALARAITQRGPYILPVRLDDTQLDGLLPTVAYLDARIEGLKGIIDAIHQKLGADRVPTPETYGGRVPKSAEEMALLVSLRPDFWEYWLYACVLKVGLGALEGKYHDYEMGFCQAHGPVVPRTGCLRLPALGSRQRWLLGSSLQRRDGSCRPAPRLW